MLAQNEENINKQEKEVAKTVENEVADSTADTVEVTEEVVETAETNEAKETKKEEKDEIPFLEYDKMELEPLVDELEKLLKNYPVEKIKSHAESLKSAFNKKFGALLSEKKEAFLAEGGNVIDFQFSSPVKSRYNQLLSQYKEKRDAYYGKLEKLHSENLQKKNQIIEDLKNLIDSGDSTTMFQEFRKLQERWKSVGAIPRNKSNDVWRTYRHHEERFYDLLHLSNDLRDLDFKHNLEKKLKIVERAEELAALDDVNVAFKELQDLHKMWKEDIGPVAREFREDIWKKFSAATKKIHDKRHLYYDDLKSKYQDIIDKKEVVIAEINNYDFSKNKTHKDWQNSIKEIETLRQKYFDAGKLPYAKSEAIWQQFKEATKKFNQNKNLFYKSEKKKQQENLQKKIALIEIAESLKDSEDWDMATEALKKVQADWKKIGHVPRKFSDEIWNRFKGACNHYFDKFHNRNNVLNKEQEALVEDKKALLDELKSMEEPTVDAIKSMVKKWHDLGQLPRKARHLEGKFNKQVDKLFGGLSIDKEEIEMLKFRNIVDGYLADGDTRKLNSEQQFVRKKIDESIREVQQLENNLSFFTNSSDSNPLVQNVHNQIDKHKEELELWQQKLHYLRTLDY